MMDFKSIAVEQCEKIPSNDKILAGSFKITHGILIRTMENLFEEHTITIEWVQKRESEEKDG